MTAMSHTPFATHVFEVKQTRDHAMVQRAFAEMTREARDFLWERLQFESRYEAGELPDRNTLTGRQLLWHELLNAAHETAGTFFLVNESTGGECEPVFISADWNSAHTWARRCLSGNGSDCRQDSSLPVLSVRSEAVIQGSSKKPPAVAAAGNK